MQCCSLVWNFKNIIELKILLWAPYFKKQKGTKIGWRGSLVEPSQVILLQSSGCLWHGITVIGKLQILSTFKPINKVLLTKLSNQRYKQTFALLYRIQCSSFRKNSMGKLFLLQCYQVNCWKLSNYGGFIFNVYQLKLVSFQTCYPSQYLKTNINKRIINKL